MLKSALEKLVARQDLAGAELGAVFEEIFSGNATPAQVGALLVALRMKGETAEEIAGAAVVMRARATRVRTPAGTAILDTCGTGGDGASTFNLSTAAALVAAAAGATVAKHGNRAVSSRSGSADVLAAAGVNVEAPVEVVEACIAELRIGFLFAPALHGVMRHVAAPRRELGLRSIFNLLGPLSNPAGASFQLLGVYDPALVPVVAATLLRLGATRALVVHGQGLDELSPSGPTRAALVEGGAIRELTIVPEDAGLRPVPLASLRGGDAGENAAVLRRLLGGEPGPLADAVQLNAGAALWVAGIAADLREGRERARECLASGAPLRTLDALVARTGGKP